MLEYQSDTTRSNTPTHQVVGDLARVGHRYASALLTASTATMFRGPADPAATPLPPALTDRRFSDPAWNTSRYFHLLQQSYLLGAELVAETLDTLPVSRSDRQRLRFLARLAVEATAPTNFLIGNPAALRKARRTRGRSLLRGAANFIGDLGNNYGLPTVVDSTGFVKGRDLAPTPGRVVFRNHLMELIQYEPRTEKVHTVPLLICSSWVNKYYIADLAPGLSVIRWLIDQGHTVFVISYRNPDKTLRDVGFEHYLREGPLAAMPVVRSITGVDEINLAGWCLGGLLALMTAAWLADQADALPRLRSITMLNSLADFTDIAQVTDTGVLGMPIDSVVLGVIDRVMAWQGYLDGRAIEAFFRLLKTDDMVWHHVITRWLLGEPPKPSILLAWNCDVVNVPYRAQRYLLHDLCMNNAFAAGTAELNGRLVRPGDIEQDVFIVAPRDDHIIPWQAAYRTIGLLCGDVRFHLVAGGHVAGILASPGYWTNVRASWTDDSEAWLRTATEHKGSWWQPWRAWLADRSGPLRSPPRIGNAHHPAQEPAPGTYVRHPMEVK
ncbi:class I poly(R)-hydroxyalkanoic acid synthase [Nocardia goodfellowii]